MTNPSTVRRRGRYLSELGLQRIKAAITATCGYYPSQEEIAQTHASLDPTTVARILNRSRRVDLTSLTRMFAAFGCELRDVDLLPKGQEPAAAMDGDIDVPDDEGPELELPDLELPEAEAPPLQPLLDPNSKVLSPDRPGEPALPTQAAAQPVVQPLAQPIDPELLGRDQAIADLDHLMAQGKRLVVIHARGGVGKSKLAWEYLKSRFYGLVIPLWMAHEPEHVISIEGTLEEWLRHYFDQEPGREFGITLDRFLQHLRKQPYPVGILIDNLESALNQEGRFLPQHRQYVEFLRQLAAPNSNAIALITSRECVAEEINCHHYPLNHLSQAAWQTFFDWQNIPSEGGDLNLLHKHYAGNAKAMEIISHTICADYGNQIAYYLQQNSQDGRIYVEKPLKDLVNRQFDRLQTQNPMAYRLLCRLGGFRYQQIPSVRREQVLQLLWDLPDLEDRKDALAALESRALLEKGKGEFWLQPTIRALAMRRLKREGEWEIVNRQIAQIWHESVQRVQKTRDALQALESYYHYLEIQDYEAAARVLIHARPNCWGTRESLGRSLYKRGLVLKLTPLLEHIQEHLSPGYLLAKTKHTLGATYWMSNELPLANARCEEAIAVVQQIYRPDSPEAPLLRRVEMNALITRGICELGRNDLNHASDLYYRALAIAHSLGDPRYEKSMQFYMGYIKSCLPELHHEGRMIVDQLYHHIQSLERNSVPSWMTEYRLFYLGLAYKNFGCIQRAREIYQMMIVLSDRSPYVQAKAKALSGLAELYREESDYDNAVQFHTQAVKLLSQIGTTCDLAEAYLQFALTYQAQGNFAPAQEYFGRSQQLFDQVGAPKQLERIQLLMHPRVQDLQRGADLADGDFPPDS
jgi:tetratricopeptide (TPR) repeat protein